MSDIDPALKPYADCPTCPYEREQSRVWLVGIHHQMGWGFWSDGSDISPHPKEWMVYEPWKPVVISEAKRVFKESHLYSCGDCVGEQRCEAFLEGILRLAKEEQEREKPH